ncbi:hypothetical protein F4776DRAFT_658795 [Hypoxylon sp. NC0597]|nr:hypothetical protein F4776DRAFT_658795 [Hypoxylon sp. NC0597]
MPADSQFAVYAGVTVAIICGSLLFVTIVSLRLVHIYRRSQPKEDRVHDLRQVEKNVDSGVLKRSHSGTAASTTWEGEVQRWQNKHDNAEPGTASNIMLSPRSNSQANTAHTNSENESSSKQRVTSDDDATSDGLFIVGSADEDDDSSSGGLQTPTITDAKAVPIIKPQDSPKPVAINIVKGRIVEDLSISSSHQNNPSRDPADSQNSKT